MRRSRRTFAGLAAGPDRLGWIGVGSRPLAAAFAVAASLVASSAAAQQSDCEPRRGYSSCIDADNLWPHAGGGPLFSIGSTGTTPPGRVAFGIVGSYLSRPIELRVPSPDLEGTDVPVVDNAFDVTFLWALGVTDRLELTIASPVTLWQDGAGLSAAVGSEDQLPSSSIRDVRFGLALALLARPRVGPQTGPALTSRAEFSLPTGDDAAFAGADGAVAAPSLTGDWRFGRLLVALELGARIRKESQLANATIGSQLAGAAGATFDVLPRGWLTAGAEVFALYTLGQQDPPAREGDDAGSGPAIAPAEFIVSASSAPFLGGDVIFALGGGGGFPLASESALTAPRLRFDLAIKYAPTGRDADGDGVADRDDRCPSDREDRDGFQDDDGCPDPDNDGDRIPDSRDRCRDAAETVDGHRDDDGCPDLDDDGDGVPDDKDRCRNAIEDKDGFQDDDGCPDPDNDKDGLLDESDRCPNGPEDKDGFKDEDGCPDPDNDLDQVPDAQDRCPSGAEDKDGFQDEDGCPDPDNDQDGVLDAADACPTAAETIDGQADADGCPEPGARSRVSWEGDRVRVDPPVKFAAGSAELGAEMKRVVAMVAQLVRGRTPETVIVEGYPDRIGDGNAGAQALAERRASAVKRAMTAAGIPADRVSAVVGDRPASPGTAAGSFEVTVPSTKRSP